MSTRRANITQKLVNSYPMWSSIRNDEQSNGAQFLNTIGLQLEDLHEQLLNMQFNSTIPFANVRDIDLIYKFFLPKTFEFTLANNNQSNPIYTPPTVSGIVGTNTYSVSLADNNDIESFWYTSIPNRINVQSFSITNIVADLASVNMYGCLASITQDQSPYTTPITLDQPFTRLWVQTTGGTKYIGIDANGIVQRCSIVITGITRQNIEATETLIFLTDDVQPTLKEYQSISKIEIYNIEPSSVIVRLFAHRFQRNQTPELAPPRDFYNLYSSPESKQDMDTFWDIGQNSLSHSILKLQTWAVDDIRIRLSGFTQLDNIRAFELYNVENAVITTANDLAVEPFNNRIWIVDNTKLYLFDNDQALPDMSQMNQKVTGAMSVMVADGLHITPGDNVTLEYLWQRPITDLVRHRVSVQFPDGSLHNAFGGSFSSYNAAAFIYNTPTDRFLRAKESYTLTTPGDYIFTLETHYTNGTKEIDQRIISVDTKQALAEFSFTSLAPGGILKGVDFDSDQNLWVLINTSGVFTKMKVVLHTDIMMIDYQNKVLFFKEPYDQVRVD